MSFRVINHGGLWIIAKDGANVGHRAGTLISYDLYQKLKYAPHEAANHFTLDDQGKPVPIDKSAPAKHD
jgi:hypothetical protein